MFINSIMSSTQQSIIQLDERGGRYSTQIPRMAKNISKIALPLITLLTLSNLSGAEAGPLEYSACVLGCTLFATPIAFPGCVTACLPLLFLPTP